MKVEVKNMPELNAVYIRHIGPYKGDTKLFENLFGKLFKWAGSKNLIGPDTKWLSKYYDDPDTTDEKELKLDVCITIPEDTEDTTVEGEIDKMPVFGGQYAVARFELAGPEEYENAWTKFFSEWLPKSGYQFTGEPCYELYRNDPQKHPQGIHIVDICVPVK